MTLIAQQTGRLAAKAISSLKRDRFIRQLPRLYASAGSEKSIVPPNVRDLAKLAQIDVSDEEVADWSPKIERIVDWFGQLQTVNVDGVPPALRADLACELSLRQDAPADFDNRHSMLEQVPEKEGAFVKVPKIATGDVDG